MKAIRILFPAIFIALALYLVPYLVFDYKPYTYLSYRVQEWWSPDRILVERTCGDYKLAIREYDRAYKGSLGLGHIQAPRFLKETSVDGYKGDKRVFATGDRAEKVRNGNNTSFWNVASTWPTLPYAFITKIFVVDEKGFKGLSSGGTATDVVAFDDQGRIPLADIQELAKCYMVHAETLDDTLVAAPTHEEAISAFVVMNSSLYDDLMPWREFACDGEKISVEENQIIRLTAVDGFITREEVGKTSTEGAFEPGSADINWQSCKASSGQTLTQYLAERAERIQYLDGR